MLPGGGGGGGTDSLGLGTDCKICRPQFGDSDFAIYQIPPCIVHIVPEILPVLLSKDTMESTF